jgi:hypothetical protein
MDKLWGGGSGPPGPPLIYATARIAYISRINGLVEVKFSTKVYARAMVTIIAPLPTTNSTDNL